MRRDGEMMAIDKAHLRHSILYKIQQRRNASQACRILLKVFSKVEFVTEHAKDGLKIFEVGEESFIDDDIVKQNPFLIISEIAKKLNSTQRTI